MTKDNRISIKQYEQAADEKVSLEGIKWLCKWDVCVQCDSEEEAEALRARLAQPEQEPVAWLYTNKLGGRQVSLLSPPHDLKDQYQPLYTDPPQANHFNPDWDALPVMVEEQQRMAKRIEELETQLGEAMWGYSEWRRKAEISSALCTRQGIRLMEYESQPEQEPVVKLKELLEVQGRDGTWNYDPYFHGMYNGMEVMLAVLENREPVFRGAPKKWLSKKEWQGLTDEEVKILATQGRTDFSRPMYNEFYDDIEAKLKEKNT